MDAMVGRNKNRLLKEFQCIRGEPDVPLFPRLVWHRQLARVSSDTGNLVDHRAVPSARLKFHLYAGSIRVAKRFDAMDSPDEDSRILCRARAQNELENLTKLVDSRFMHGLQKRKSRSINYPVIATNPLFESKAMIPRE
jgi:hypothetical protein